MKKDSNKEKKIVIILHMVLVVMECIAAAYMFSTDGLSMFRYYTVDSNVLQLFVSGAFLVCFARNKEIPKALTVLHLVCAVCLTVTFLIAAFVLMPQSTFEYYFLANVAPINHFLGPLLSVIALMLCSQKIPKPAFIAPAAVSLLYGIAALILNAVKVLDGPYFFLEVYSTPLPTIVMWFVIITILCVGLTVLYMFLHSRILKGK